MLITDYVAEGRYAQAQVEDKVALHPIPAKHARQKPLSLPCASELDVIRHYTRLSQLNFCIDTHFYPLGSCTMKYNPRGIHQMASMKGFLDHHPLAPDSLSQGILEVVYTLQSRLSVLTGFAGVALSPMAGAQGELAGIRMIHAYHDARGDTQRRYILVPEAAHGTNPATATMAGYEVIALPNTSEGHLSIASLKDNLGPQIAGIMLTNPSPLGVFETHIREIADLVHGCGALLYYDGANFNALMGCVTPAAMGFDVMHLNLHKTFATPHGGGGPGAGPVACTEALMPFLPIPRVQKTGDHFKWIEKEEAPHSIGRLSAFMGNMGVLVRALAYCQLLGEKGLSTVSRIATLNAAYLQNALQKIGYTLAFPTRRASHEFIITLVKEKAAYGITALDLAKRLLDYGMYAPTVYFPLLVPECLLIEPTETESLETLDKVIAIFETVWKEIHEQPQLLKDAPQACSRRRIDEVKAARELMLVAQPID